jgi:DNA end-binding protein Ku
VCPHHGELQAEEIVSGYQYAKEQYVVIDPEEVKKLRRQSDKAVSVDGFFPSDALDPVYFGGRSYYLVPDGPVGQKAYHLLHKVMSEKGLYALAHVVLSGKEQLVLLRTQDRLLVMAVLSYDSQVKKSSAFEDELVDAAFTDAEVTLTEKLVEATMLGDLDLSAYKNPYTEQLTELIEAKVAGQEIVAAPAAEEPKVVELMEALKASVARIQEGEGAAPRRKMAKSQPKKQAKKAGSKKSTKKKMAPSTAKRATSTRKKKSG